MDYRKLNLTFAFALATVLAVAFFGFAQAQQSDPDPGKLNDQGEEVIGKARGFSAIVTLDDESLDKLVGDGRIEVPVPPQLANSLNSVIIKRPLHFKDEKAYGFADAQLTAKRLFINVDDAILERIDYQPVELRTYEAGVSSIVLNFVGLLPDHGADDSGDAETDSPMLTVKLKSGKGLTGRIRGMKTLMLNSVFGEISIDYAKTRSIITNDAGGLKVEMLNGDLVTGKISVDQIEVVNRWGLETIPISDVDSLAIKRARKKVRTRQRETGKAGVSRKAAIPTTQNAWPSNFNTTQPVTGRFSNR